MLFFRHCRQQLPLFYKVLNSLRLIFSPFDAIQSNTQYLWCHGDKYAHRPFPGKRYSSSKKLTGSYGRSEGCCSKF
jgi:hypothetical protein